MLEIHTRQEFVENVNRVNELAATSVGFVWRWEEDPAMPPERIDGDPLIVINFSVWESIPHLKDFVFKGLHGTFFKRRAKWFEQLG